jgi:hypothetical protein
LNEVAAPEIAPAAKYQPRALSRSVNQSRPFHAMTCTRLPGVTPVRLAPLTAAQVPALSV